jgi:hydroxybutyrate-dimer hydrolase
MAMPRLLVAVTVLALAGCAAAPPRIDPMIALGIEGGIVESRHQGNDDLLSAGLGLERLRQLPPPASPGADAAELRRRAIWTSWRGIADLRPDTVPQPLPSVPGREFAALLRLPGDRQPHRVLLQLPDSFDPASPCLLVAPASGSRGVYGAIAVAGPVGLARGCAVVYTDKGAGSDFTPHGATGVYVPHAHSGDNPEARWGEHVLAAARFGLAMLDRAGLRPQPFTAADTRIVAVALSNGGGAVLRAAEIDQAGLLDAVIAGAPNVQPVWGPARPLFDYGTEAALYQPCLLSHPDWRDAPFNTDELRRAGQQRCALLRAAGLLDANTARGQAQEALERLLGSGWELPALRMAAQNVAFDLWRAVAVTYASAYGRYGPAAHPCGFSFAPVDGRGRPRAAGELEQRLWRSDGAGIPPTAGIALLDPHAAGDDAALPGLMCLRRLWQDDGPDGERVRAGIQATRASGRPLTAAITVLHGRDDGLVPVAFTSRPWVAAARAHGAAVEFQELDDVQHFDAFLPFPAMVGYRPLLPAVWQATAAALDRP